MNDVKGELIKLASEMSLGKNMPSPFREDWKFPKSTTISVIKTAQKVGEDANEQCLLWSIRLKKIIDKL